MAATRARTELAAASAPHNVKDVTASREAAASVDPASNDKTPARRTTTRTRKLPSRLLPSPSPPPSRPSSAYSAAKQAKGGKDATESASASPAGTPSASSGKSRKASKTEADSIGSDLEASGDKVDGEDLGPGKRKRRPSTMYKPPSTLTTVETPSPASASSASKSKKKGRSISPEALTQKSQSPSLAVNQARGKSRFSKGKLEAATSLSKKGEVANAGSLRGNGDDSEAELEPSRSCVSKRMRIGDADDSMDLSPPPLLPRDGSARIRMPMHFTQPTFIRGGRVSVSPEASGKRPIKFGIRDFSKSTLQSDLGVAEQSPIGNVMRANKGPFHRSDIMSSSPVSAGVNKFDNDLGTPLTYVPFRSGAHTEGGFRNMHTTPFVAQTADEADEEEDDDDENDFHQAMLDADFEFFDSQKSDLNVSKPFWSALRRGTAEDVDIYDTPATTPRSVQSGCDLSSPDSSRCKIEESVTLPSNEDTVLSYSAVRDSVFVHALPTTQVGADKPHQHAGSLTLSLPYSPVTVSSPQLRAMDIDADVVTCAKGSKEAASAQMSTPVLQRRKHAGLPAGPHGLAPLKLSADLMERSTSNAAPYMQLSPMIEMESPLLSPGLSLSLHTKGSDLPSPFLMGVGTLTELEQPEALDLTPAEGSTTPKAASPEISAPEASETNAVPTPTVETKAEVSKNFPSSFEPTKPVIDAVKEAVKMEKPSARRPALPPPRQIRFTTVTTPSVELIDSRSQQSESSKAEVPTLPNKQKQTTQHQTQADGASTTSPKSDSTPDLVQSGSSSPDSASDSPSPKSEADTASSADTEVENILFGPPEKLDMHELDHAWGGNKAAQHEAAMRQAKVTQLHHVDIDVDA
ncbi:uncharacterized protein MEPE_00287 [Melanopsichium pennsylvanicum]|uniref:Uncharacterized protein n=2 Tax=Melanopsichium pennsylvanicum TaxID=63383 RepID=A0AAJ4XGB7_9BASI|nr:putative protein [Melanopsichium pennsylvanicum 4]SNX81582.1 uncharacterized protein MEPE_00287 [Melanopsichium pennsylvanicum]